MTFIHRVRRAVVAMLTGAVLACGAVSTPIVIGALTPAAAQISEDAQIALEQYGSWRRIHASAKSGASRGATRLASIEYGQWVYTDEWGWYWVSDDVVANWPLGCLSLRTLGIRTRNWLLLGHGRRMGAGLGELALRR